LIGSFISNLERKNYQDWTESSTTNLIKITSCKYGQKIIQENRLLQKNLTNVSKRNNLANNGEKNPYYP